MRTIRCLTVAALLSMATGGWRPPPALAAVPAPPAANPLSQDTKDLLKRLQSTNPAERQAAQEQLNAIMELFRQQEALKQLADAAPDAELKSFFQTRIAQLKAKEEERLAANLPGISLSVSNASLADVVDALNQALDTSNKLQYQNDGNPVASYTLEVKNKPFWEVVAALQQQQPFAFGYGPITTAARGGITVTTSMGMRISSTNAGSHPFIIDGPGIAFLNGITLSRSLSLQSTTPTSSRPTLSVSLAVMADPRLHVGRVKMPTITNAVDDQGRNLTPPTATSGFTTGNAASTSRSFSLNTSPSLGKSLSLTLESAFEITTGNIIENIDDVQNNLDKAIIVGDHTVRVTAFNSAVSPTSASMTITSTPNAPTSGTAPPMTITLLDATGRTVRPALNITGSITTAFPTSAFTPPYKLEIRASTGTVLIPVRFQFKDIPLP